MQCSRVGVRVWPFIPRGYPCHSLPVRAGGVSRPVDGGRGGGVPLRGYGPYILFMWSIHSVGQSWYVVSSAGGHAHVGSPSLCMRGHRVRFHSSMSHVLIQKLAPHFVWCQCQCSPLWCSGIGDGQCWQWCWIPCCTWGLGGDASHGDMGVGVDTLCRR